MTRTMLTVARVIGVVLAVVVVLVLGVPALLGWVPLPVDDEASGVARGTLVVVAPSSASTQVEPGDVVTLVTPSGGLVTRTVRELDESSFTTSAAGDGTTRVGRDRLRAVERYSLPMLGHVARAVPATHRPWWGRLIGLAFLAWAVAELVPALRRRRAPGGDAAALGVAPTRRAIAPGPRTGASAVARRGSHAGAARAYRADDESLTGEADHPLARAGERADDTPLPTRRDRARARRSTPWSRLTDLAASAVGAVVMATRAFDHRHEDPADGTGRHRSPMPTTTVDLSRVHDDAQPTAGHATGSVPPRAASAPSAPAVDARTGITSAAPPSRRVRRSESETEAAVSAGGDTGGAARVWARRPSKDEVARAVQVQDFEARRAAAEAAARHDISDENVSPVDCLLGEREARRARRDPDDT